MLVKGWENCLVYWSMAHVADPHLTTQYGQTSQQGADSVAKVIYQVGDWSDLTRCNLGTLSGTLEFPIDSIKLLFCSIRVVEHRHQLLPLVHLLDVAVELSQEFLLPGVVYGSRFHNA